MFSIATSSLRRAAYAASATSSGIASNATLRQQQRHLSMACASSVNKLNGILEEYRVKNYAQCFPRRFYKDVVKAATINSHYMPAVSADGIEHLLHNIGMGNRISRSEIEGIISEVGECSVGGSEKALTADQMLDLISRNWEDHHQGLNQP